MSRATEAPADRAKRFVEIHSHEPNLILDPVPMSGDVDRLAGDDDFRYGDLRAMLDERAELLKERERSKTYVVKVSRPQTDYTTYVGPSGGDAWTAHTIRADLYKLFVDLKLDLTADVIEFDAATPPKSEEKGQNTRR